MDKAGGSSEKSGMVLPVNTGQVWLFSVSSDFGQGTGKREAGEEYNMNLTCSSRGVRSPLLRPKSLYRTTWAEARTGQEPRHILSFPGHPKSQLYRENHCLPQPWPLHLSLEKLPRGTLKTAKDHRRSRTRKTLTGLHLRRAQMDP